MGYLKYYKIFPVNSPQIWTDSVSNLDPALDLELEKLATEEADSQSTESDEGHHRLIAVQIDN